MQDHQFRKNTQQTQVSMRSTGKIYKGTINDAPMKVRVASIPSKSENVIYRNNKPSAFGNSRDRFYSEFQKVKKFQPGPGNYDHTHQTQQKIYSKKGYGTLISNTKLQRLQLNYNRLSGPGSYNPNAKILSKAKRSNSLALLSSKIQGHDLFRNELQKSKRVPGPGVYEAKLRSNSLTHIFSNKIPRFENPTYKQQVPGVGHYIYNDSSLKKVLEKQMKVGYKKPGHEIDEINQQQKLKIVRQVLNNNNRNLINSQKKVGPGSYDVHLLDKKIGFKICETNYDRFGQSLKKQEQNKKLSSNQNQQYIPSPQTDTFVNDIIQIREEHKFSKGLTSMFKSNIARYDFLQPNVNDPGKYSPEKPQKKSHIVNFEKKWI